MAEGCLKSESCLKKEKEDADLKKYDEYISYLARNNKNELFFNSGSEHAKIVLKNIFKTSKENIRIFGASLCCEVANSDEYIYSLMEFLERGGRLRILLNQLDLEALKSKVIFKKFFYYLQENRDNDQQKELLKIKSTKRRLFLNSKNSDKVDPIEIHFTTGDGKAYRKETNITDQCAQCNFNDSDMTKKFIEKFDEIFDDKANLDVNLFQLFKV